MDYHLNQRLFDGNLKANQDIFLQLKKGKSHIVFLHQDCHRFDPHRTNSPHTVANVFVIPFAVGELSSPVQFLEDNRSTAFVAPCRIPDKKKQNNQNKIHLE